LVNEDNACEDACFGHAPTASPPSTFLRRSKSLRVTKWPARVADCAYIAERRRPTEMMARLGCRMTPETGASFSRYTVITFCPKSVSNKDLDAKYGGDGGRDRTRACWRSVHGACQGCIHGTSGSRVFPTPPRYAAPVSGGRIHRFCLNLHHSLSTHRPRPRILYRLSCALLV